MSVEQTSKTKNWEKKMGYVNTQERTDYIGFRYDGQCTNQTIYLYLEGQTNEVYFDVDGSTSGSCSPDIFHKRDIRFSFPVDLLSDGNQEDILEDLKEDIENLLESYEECYNGNNYVGQWNEELIKKITNYINRYDYDTDFPE